MKLAEIREMGADQVKEKLVELKKELFNLRFQNDVGQLENTATLSNVKKDIANRFNFNSCRIANIVWDHYWMGPIIRSSFCKNDGECLSAICAQSDFYIYTIDWCRIGKCQYYFMSTLQILCYVFYLTSCFTLWFYR